MPHSLPPPPPAAHDDTPRPESPGGSPRAASPRPPLLGPGEPPAVTVLEGTGDCPVLLVCDHAANRVPDRLQGLGLSADDLARHIGWDIGAAAVTAALARRLGASAVLSGYSRLVVDVNRVLDHPTLMPEVSDGTPVPGNANLTPAEREERLATLFHPYHERIAARIAALRARGQVPVLVSIHSFTPCLRGAVPRPWHVGILWNRDPRLALPLLDALRAEGDLVVGDNEPYSARGALGYTINTHAEPAGLPAVMLEIRQDLIDTPAGAEAWGERLARLLRPILAQPDLRDCRVY